MIDYTNNPVRYGKLIVLREIKIDRRSYFVCKCDCGKEKTTRKDAVLNGRTVSCGCYNRQLIKEHHFKHGACETREYKIWKGMIARCRNPARLGYENYGGRGIKVCERWSGDHGFENFLIDMGKVPSLKHTIERMNNDGNYEPENCKWDTRKNQARNRRQNHFLTHDGKTQCILDWSIETGISRATIYYRLGLGWSVEKVLTPTSTYRSKY